MSNEFNVDENPQDMQTMQDAVGIAMQLKDMDDKQISNVWPKVVRGLYQDNPKVKNVLSPSKPPTQAQVQQIVEMARQRTGAKPPQDMAQQLDQGPVNTADIPVDPTQAQGVMKPMAAGGQEVSKTAKTQLQKDIIELDTNLGDLGAMYESMDWNAFTYGDRVKTYSLAELEKVSPDLLSKEQKDFLGKRTAQRQSIDRFMLKWRKYITGVAGGEKEMRAIEDSILNKRLSPSEAKGALNSLFKKIARDRDVKMRLLQNGISPGGMSKSKYSREFNKMRQEVANEHNSYIKRFKKANPKASDIDALLYLNYKRTRGQE